MTGGAGKAKTAAAKAELGPRLRWDKDKLGRLLVLDCSNNSRDEAYAQFEATHKVLLAEPPASVRLLVDFENAVHETALTRLWKEASIEHDKRVTKVALVGVTGGMKVVVAAYRFYVMVRGLEADTKMAFFDEESEARAWLEGA